MCTVQHSPGQLVPLRQLAVSGLCLHQTKRNWHCASEDTLSSKKCTTLQGWCCFSTGRVFGEKRKCNSGKGFRVRASVITIRYTPAWEAHCSVRLHRKSKKGKLGAPGREHGVSFFLERVVTLNMFLQICNIDWDDRLTYTQHATSQMELVMSKWHYAIHWQLQL